MLTGGIVMYAVLIILLLIAVAAAGQLYVSNREAFRKRSKHLATRRKYDDDSNGRLI
ncbi:hypothetical protein FD13_GL000103 [Levilactobacillus senmaizukei DSM 21775 = NBRC 103853]|uniref:Uncharacterized protein n=2 Tax=Levilactobacillus TaxID=2767886 RepID=A0A0R2DGW4_9LACO|nr:hypothetical protein FD13_GL000103 [Levilactobacillus senmaizukei DSM 21775 = NBRC 103853]